MQINAIVIEKYFTRFVRVAKLAISILNFRFLINKLLLIYENNSCYPFFTIKGYFISMCKMKPPSCGCKYLVLYEMESIYCEPIMPQSMWWVTSVEKKYKSPLSVCLCTTYIIFLRDFVNYLSRFFKIDWNMVIIVKDIEKMSQMGAFMENTHLWDIKKQCRAGLSSMSLQKCIFVWNQ